MILKKTILKISSILLVLIFTGCATKEFKVEPKYTISEKKDKTIVSLKQGKDISLEQLVKELENYPVIFVGDHHNTEKTHKFFENFLNELVKKGYNLHMTNEWFSPQHNKLLKDYTDNKINSKVLKEKREWDKFTKYKWELVEPLYEAVKNSNGRLYGANISKEDREKISLKKIEKMSEELKAFYNSLDLDVSSHRSLVMPYLDHCHKYSKKDSKEPCDERMYRVQVTWDTYMAEQSANIAKEVIKTKKDKLIVFAGALHMEYGVGIPLRFSRVSNLPSYIISNQAYTKETKDLKIDQLKADAIFVYEKEIKALKMTKKK